MTITFPRYSFVQAPIAPEFCLPLSSPAHLSFQATFEHIPHPPVSGIALIQIKAFAVPVDTACSFQQGVTIGQGISFNDGVITALDSADGFNLSLNFSSPVTSWDWLNEHSDYPPIEVGSCFKLLFQAFFINASGEPIYVDTLGCTGCFIRTAADDSYASVLKYRCAENSFDFNYTLDTAFYNSVELPFYLKEPTLTTDQKTYTKSNGEVIKLYDRKEEVYELETDYLPYTWLKNLDIALSHDVVAIANSTLLRYDPLNTATHFAKKEPLELAYNPTSLSTLGKATSKLTNVSPVHLINNNCN